MESDGFTLFFPETSYGTDVAKIVRDFGRVRRHAGHHLSELPKWKNVILSLRGHLSTRNYTDHDNKPSFGISARPGAFSVRVNKVLTIFSLNSLTGEWSRRWPKSRKIDFVGICIAKLTANFFSIIFYFIFTPFIGIKFFEDQSLPSREKKIFLSFEIFPHCWRITTSIFYK